MKIDFVPETKYQYTPCPYKRTLPSGKDIAVYSMECRACKGFYDLDQKYSNRIECSYGAIKK